MRGASYMVEYMRFAFMCREKPPSNNLKVAIIGAGPAGLAASGYLSCKGYDVDVYDKQPLPGGLMIFAIPPWRIPRESVLSGVEELREKFSVNFVLRTKIYSGVEEHEEGDLVVEKKLMLEEIVEKYHAVLITTGTWASKIPTIPGVDARGVYSALDYLYKHRLFELNFISERPPRGKRVVVVGGGYSAVDAAEQALRSGAEAYVVYRRTIKEAPSGIYEIRKLEREGAIFMELVSPVEVVVENNAVKAIKLQKMQLGPPDETGRPKPVPIPGSEFTIEADIVVFATGEQATPPVSRRDRSVLEKLGIKLTKNGTVEVNEIMQTGNPKVFAAGDVVHGPSRIGPAIRSGLYAARFLDNWLQAKLIKLVPLP